MNPEDVYLPPSFSIPILSESSHTLSTPSNSPVPPRSPAETAPVRSIDLGRRGRAYQQLMRWYPADWRERNSEALIGVMLDQADERNHSGPSFADRASIILGGLRERLLSPGRRNGRTVSVLGLGTAFAALYLYYVAWSPSVSIAGAIWPFSNSLVIPASLMGLAFAVSMTPWTRVARFLALASALSAISIGILGAWFGWQGPSWYTVALFAGFALLGALPSQRTSTLFFALLGLAGIVIVGILAPNAFVLLVDLGPVAWVMTALLATLVGVTIAHLRRKRLDLPS